ncbi:hypothetical protein K439DRAFT_1616861 [Ramaria rubella]|nr:hypothetical protein K439DRAFT_1616861 [Ramaria rubella]
MANVLGCFLGGMGQYDEAVKLHNRVLTGFERSLGYDSPSALKVIIDLTEVFGSQGKTKDAEAFFTQALLGYEKTLPTNHIKTLKAIYLFGQFCDLTEQYKQAEALFSHTAVGYGMQLGRGHILSRKSSHMAAGAATSLGEQYLSDNKFEEAEKAYSHALIRHEDEYSLEPGYALCMAESLAKLYEQWGKLAEAEIFYLQVLHGSRTETLGWN